MKLLYSNVAGSTGSYMDTELCIACKMQVKFLAKYCSVVNELQKIGSSQL